VQVTLIRGIAWLITYNTVIPVNIVVNPRPHNVLFID
jgi:hypothetical protein